MGARELDSFSILHWYHDTDSHKCGYCKSPDGSRSHGMWAESLTVEDYQDLIDRGWRRSGHYCYKPIMNNTCCPQYAIRCAALDINLSKSQKKVIKKLNRFLTNGEMQKFEADKESEDGDGDVQFQEHFASRKEPTVLVDHSQITESGSEKEDDNEAPTVLGSGSSVDNIAGTHSELHGDSVEMNVEQKVTNKRLKKQKPDLKGGLGADPEKPKCKKAKLLRLERKRNKQTENRDSSGKSHKQKNVCKTKTIEQFVLEIPEEATLQYSLKLKLVRSGEPENEWKKYEEVEFQLYKKYQTIIHNDRDLSVEDFRRFLVSSPLIYQQFPENEHSDPSLGFGFGSFHQQYWLNDKLIAVGVIDILPKCVSSVYLFYDPDYRNLTLGTYSSMREVHFTRFLHTLVPSIEYYYMGFYIHSCPKMRYKGRLCPSYLLCPETYTWIPIECCIPKLDEVKYSRLSQSEDADSNAGDLHEMSNVRVIVGHRLTFYKFIRRHKQFQVAMKNIGTLIGKPCANRMVFVLT